MDLPAVLVFSEVFVLTEGGEDERVATVCHRPVAARTPVWLHCYARLIEIRKFTFYNRHKRIITFRKTQNGAERLHGGLPGGFSGKRVEDVSNVREETVNKFVVLHSAVQPFQE